MGKWLGLAPALSSKLTRRVACCLVFFILPSSILNAQTRLARRNVVSASPGLPFVRDGRCSDGRWLQCGTIDTQRTPGQPTFPRRDAFHNNGDAASAQSNSSDELSIAVDDGTQGSWSNYTEKDTTLHWYVPSVTKDALSDASLAGSSSPIAFPSSTPARNPRRTQDIPSSRPVDSDPLDFPSCVFCAFEDAQLHDSRPKQEPRCSKNAQESTWRYSFLPIRYAERLCTTHCTPHSAARSQQPQF